MTVVPRPECSACPLWDTSEVCTCIRNGDTVRMTPTETLATLDLPAFDPASMPLESHAVMGDAVFDMHTGKKVIALTGGLMGAIGRQQAEFDLQLRELRRDLLLEARASRARGDMAKVLFGPAGGSDAGADVCFGYAAGCRHAARGLREVLR